VDVSVLHFKQFLQDTGEISPQILKPVTHQTFEKKIQFCVGHTQLPTSSTICVIYVELNARWWFMRTFVNMNITHMYKSDSVNGSIVDVGLLRCNAMWTRRSIPKF
jgi:hypothetical protein